MAQYPYLNFQKNLPKKGFAPATQFALVLGISAIGVSIYVNRMKKLRETERYRIGEREALVPFLDLEREARLRQVYRAQQRENLAKAEALLRYEAQARANGTLKTEEEDN